ncbi:type III secretion system chaperone [Variovorax sp. KK3]|uniref:type III secretion system chaperone n=1 Tax=Variovorax sp. KK3 TaxID=1855728 RepID=UPI00097BD762|nr:type III secretion system chaperone [Variovorax sp. KK3]
MNQLQFEEMSQAVANILLAEVAIESEGRCALLIQGIDVLVDLGEDDALQCYVDLGTPSPADRNTVCEQLLKLNLLGSATEHGSFAFEPETARAVFCERLPDAGGLEAEELAAMLRKLVDYTSDARQMVANPAFSAQQHADSTNSIFFLSALA